MRTFMTMRRYSGLAESGDALLVGMKKSTRRCFFLLNSVSHRSSQRESECVANANCVAFVTGTSGDVACIADRIACAFFVLHP